jgi:NAD(P)-dependent dehydrogenase (short-subunit alcohol dehydrogenase family)
MDQRNVLITGASSGFGKLMAISLVEKGYKVWASMRDLEGKNRTKAEELDGETQNQSGTLEVLELDVTKMQSVQKAIDHIRETDGKLEVIVNNAGVGSMALLEDFTEVAFVYLLSPTTMLQNGHWKPSPKVGDMNFHHWALIVFWLNLAPFQQQTLWIIWQFFQ